MTEDVAFSVELAREVDGLLVELLSETAASPFLSHRQRVETVIGVDSSPAMLDQSRVRAAEAPLRQGPELRRAVKHRAG